MESRYYRTEAGELAGWACGGGGGWTRNGETITMRDIDEAVTRGELRRELGHTEPQLGSRSRSSGVCEQMKKLTLSIPDELHDAVVAKVGKPCWSELFRKALAKLVGDKTLADAPKRGRPAKTETTRTRPNTAKGDK